MGERITPREVAAEIFEIIGERDLARSLRDAAGDLSTDEARRVETSLERIGVTADALSIAFSATYERATLPGTTPVHHVRGARIGVLEISTTEERPRRTRRRSASAPIDEAKARPGRPARRALRRSIEIALDRIAEYAEAHVGRPIEARAALARILLLFGCDDLPAFVGKTRDAPTGRARIRFLAARLRDLTEERVHQYEERRRH